MPRARPFAELVTAINADPVRRQRIETDKRAMHVALEIAQLRDKRNLSWDRAALLTSEDDDYLAALRDLVAEMGGDLEVKAVFPEGEVFLVPRGT